MSTGQSLRTDVAILKTGSGSIETATAELRKSTADLNAAIADLMATWKGDASAAFNNAAILYQDRQEKNQRILAEIASAVADSSTAYARNEEDRSGAAGQITASLA